MVTAAEVKKMKVAELKAELTARGLATDGKKDVLVARLEEALSASPATAPAPQADRLRGELELDASLTIVGVITAAKAAMGLTAVGTLPEQMAQIIEAVGI